MKKLLLALSALAALSLLAPTTGVAQTAPTPWGGWYNHIGVYTTTDANPDNVAYNGAPGQITAYAVITNPRNYNVGGYGSGVEADITIIGGFEFKLTLPAGTFLLGAVLPPNSTNFASAPNFFVGTNLPVVNHVATAVTLSIGAFAQAEGYVFMSPVDLVPSVPDGIAITDLSDGFRISEAFPASGDFANPVFGLWPATPIVPTEDASWGDVHSLYR